MGLFRAEEKRQRNSTAPVREYVIAGTQSGKLPFRPAVVLATVSTPAAAKIASSLAIAVLLICPTVAKAHPAHETHAEITWNAATRVFEVALKVRGVDLESAISHEDASGRRIDLDHAKDADARITQYLRSHFVIKSASMKTARLSFIGKELDSRTAWLYFEFAVPDHTAPTGCSITNRVLFDTLKGQINRIELRVGDHKQILALNARSPTVVIEAIDSEPEFTQWMPPASLETLPAITTLPDVFAMHDGRRVQRLADWERRRTEIKKMIQYYEYGHLPPRPDKVNAVSPMRKASHGGLGVAERMLLQTGTKRKLRFHLSINSPAEGTRDRYPVIVTNVHRITELPCIEMFLKSGFAFVQYQREDLDPDQANIKGPAQIAYPEHDWATLAVWAWGAMRVVDYLESRSDIDLERIAITGHSRGGKAALLAGALDDRFALVAPNGSGCGGAGCFRGSTEKNETLAQITDPQRFGYWFHKRLRWFAGKEDRLPFDQHFVKALVAPRALLCTEARGDMWANPIGTRRTNIAARDVYSFLDVKTSIGLCYRDGQHDQTMSDWRRLLEFAEWHFFDRIPDDPNSFWQSP